MPETVRPFYDLAANIVEHLRGDPARNIGADHAIEQPVIDLVQSILECTLRAEGPILDLATLDAVHNHYEFEAATKDEFDRYLHKQILRAKRGRDLTADELQAFVNDADEPIR